MGLAQLPVALQSPPSSSPEWNGGRCAQESNVWNNWQLTSGDPQHASGAVEKPHSTGEAATDGRATTRWAIAPQRFNHMPHGLKTALASPCAATMPIEASTVRLPG